MYYEDTDAGGVVFYANYLKFMERARTEWLRSLGVSQHQLAAAEGLVFVVSRLEVSYKAPAMLDDLLTVQSFVTQARRASLHFSQRIVRQGSELATSQVRVGCVDRYTLRPTGLPTELHQRLSLTSQR